MLRALSQPAVKLMERYLPDPFIFVVLLTLTILLVGGLTFLPALALGPLAEHLAMFPGF